MTKNEYIASIMLEAADLLREDNEQEESLNEGILGAVTAITIGTIAIPLAGISLYNLISQMSNKNKIKKLSKNENDLKEYIGNIDKGWEAVVDLVKKGKVKLAYKKSAKEKITKMIVLINKYSKELENIDHALMNLKSVEDFYNHEDTFEAKYKNLRTRLKDDYNKIFSIKSDEWVESNDIIPLMNKFMDTLSNSYYKTTDGDDYWEAFDWFISEFQGDEDGSKDPYERRQISVDNDLYRTFTTMKNISDEVNINIVYNDIKVIPIKK